MTLEKETRDAIGRTVRSLRELFEDEFGKQASGRFGIRSAMRSEASDSDGLDAWLDPVESLSLTPAEFAQRDELIHALQYLTSEGNEPGEAVARLIREAAFTAVNRLLAIRVAEAIGVLPPVLSAGRQSAGYRETVGDLFPSLTHDEDGYWIYLQVAGDELAPGVPRLFDRRQPTSAFVPSRACVDEALALLTAEELAGAWIEPETLGWGYQFFNGDDVKEMRDASAAPRNSRELAVRNQFFTPRYVVDWLVQNTLGRRLVQAGYELDLPLLVGEIGDHEPLTLEDVRVLDPAVGSGHFLLGSYDLLEQAWQSSGVSPEEAAARILPCLFGVDIDPRAAQVAQAVLLLRGRRAASDADLTPPTIVTAVALPHSPQLREQAFGSLSPAARHLADAITEDLDLAPDLGSLIKVDESLGAELSRQETAPRLAIDGTQDVILEELHSALGALVSTAVTPEERMFTADASDALRLVDVLQYRYDVVLMNPPFGEGVTGSPRDALKALYPEWWTELYACFLSRAFELLRDYGVTGMLSSSQYFITRRMRELRELIAEDYPPVGIIDLGGGVLAGATVNTAAAVFADGRRASHVAYRDLTSLAPAEREHEVRRQFERGDWRRIDVRQFSNLDRTPFAFHVPDSVLELWQGAERLEPSVAEVRSGQRSFDNFRFLRLAWEFVEIPTGWVRYQKGGEFKTYVEPSHLLTDWRDDGREMRTYGEETVGTTAQIVQASDYWKLPGLTAPHTSSVGFGARFLPRGEMFGSKAVCIFPRHERDTPTLLGVMNSTVFAELVRVFGRTRATENGALKAMPVGPDLLKEARDAGMDDLVSEIAHELYRWETRDETSPYFASPFACGGPRSSSRATDVHIESATLLSNRQREVDRIARAAFGVSDDVVLDADVTRRDDLIEQSLRWTKRTAPKRWAEDCVSWAVGVSFGRWDPAANALAFSLPLLREEAPEPPALVNDMPSLLLPARGESSLARLAADVLDRAGEQVLADVLGALSSVELGDWIEQKFFAVHLARYSRSRRYAPIYWQLAVPSKRWGLWLYAPSLSRESLFAIVRAAQEKASSLNEQIGLARERVESDRDARERAESLEDLAAEVEKFAAVADEVAQSGWVPDLNDGFVLNAAPLEELFVDKKWRGQIAKHRKAMQKGDYPWATVQREYFEARA